MLKNKKNILVVDYFGYQTGTDKEFVKELAICGFGVRASYFFQKPVDFKFYKGFNPCSIWRSRYNYVTYETREYLPQSHLPNILLTNCNHSDAIVVYGKEKKAFLEGILGREVIDIESSLPHLKFKEIEDGDSCTFPHALNCARINSETVYFELMDILSKKQKKKKRKLSDSDCN